MDSGGKQGKEDDLKSQLDTIETGSAHIMQVARVSFPGPTTCFSLRHFLARQSNTTNKNSGFLLQTVCLGYRREVNKTVEVVKLHNQIQCEVVRLHNQIQCEFLLVYYDLSIYEFLTS